MRVVMHLPSKVLLAGLLAVALVATLLVATAHAQESTVRIAPGREGDTAVRHNPALDRRLKVSGSAPAGNITAAKLVALDAQGAVVGEQIVPGANRNNPNHHSSDDYLYNDGGQLRGELTLGCTWFGSIEIGCPSTPAQTVRDVRLDLTVGGQQLSSNPLRVDYHRPFIRRYELISPTIIRVVFSEPVRPGDAAGDQPSDWRVSDPEAQVLRVENRREQDCAYLPGEDPRAGTTNCTRYLHMTPVDGDATPLVAYTPAPRAAYEDFASNQLLLGDELNPDSNAVSRALDRVRPPVPSIEEVAGRDTRSDGRAHANDSDPDVRVGNVSAGHTITVTATGSNGSSVSATETAANDGAVTVTLPPLGADGTYSIAALAVDPNGNRSDDFSKGAPRPDGSPNPVIYTLDTVAPRIVAAALETRRRVQVVFNEPVSPAGHAGRWTVNDQTATAEGSDRQRRLTTSGDINGDEVVVKWEPEATTALRAGRYYDAAGNEMEPQSVPVIGLPPIVGPVVLQPASETYTRASAQVISGTAGDEAIVDLLERNTNTVVSSTRAQGRTWSFTQTLPADGRYMFAVQSREEASGSRSARAPVPDIVRDTAKPLLTVTSPAPEPSASQPDGRPRRGVGGTVTVGWIGSDPAPSDPQRTDHGAGVDIDIVFADNTVRRVARNEPHAPGQQRTFTYTITREDLAGLGSREAHFLVTLRDLAGNATSATSAPFVIVGDLLDYAPVLVERGVIEARFPVALSGETSGAEWYVDGKPAQTATRTQRDGRSVIRITDATVRDPNATPRIRYEPSAINPSPLRGPGDSQISTAERFVADGILPALSITSRDSQGVVVDRDHTTLSGTTDRDTAKPNTVHAFVLNEDGSTPANPAASTQADAEGRWTLNVPLRPDHRNQIVVQAVDPNSNRSQTLPEPPALVIEDSTPPVVNFTAPDFGAVVPRTIPLRWALTEANLLSVTVDYRVDGGEWRGIEQTFSDDGALDFKVPAEDVNDKTLGFRVIATDQTGKTGEAVVDGLRVDLAAPELVKARATGAQVVDVTFSEPVTVDGSGFSIDGATVRRVKGDGLTRTFILNRAVATTTPTVEYTGTTVTNDAGTIMEPTSVRAKRSFAFGVTALKGQRVTSNRVRVSWNDSRNRPADLRGYRIYRDGSPIALVGSATRAFTDVKGKGRHVYSVRAVDDRRRVSSIRRVVVAR